MNQNLIIEKYICKILAKATFKTNKPYIYIEDLSNVENLKNFLYDMNIMEFYLTTDGLNFLSEYYGIDGVAKIILKEIEEGIDYKYRKIEDIIAWIKRKGLPQSAKHREVLQKKFGNDYRL